ncbi:class I SAM-dependent methyltransferase [Teichococcus aestuarii]|uniref:Methyltransferase type 11 n=1 Tax=Teichococcus aestuarii TaxID=568898 RepID=A0A2U1UY48_9PROT|nr:class I SAM-dependent methyltransferase [Pseudoroseomonas aestuarii]PWC26589.1 methyltransferase type 11 [Pseudoroseomonas aestuarii]
MSWYDTQAAALVPRYEAVPPAALHGWWRDLLPASPGAVLDIGAGSGRDAAWFATLGHAVVAAEPSSAMRQQGQRLHPDPRIRWTADALPELAGLLQSGLSFDAVLLSAVWQHVPPLQRARAFRKICTLLKPGGLLVLTLRQGPAPVGSGMHPVSLGEIEALARDHGLMPVRQMALPDQQGRPEVSWTGVALRLPDDGTGALPLLRHVILNDAKSTTYKLGLLRALLRAADGAAGLAEPRGEAEMVLPLGLLALNWLRLYRPLVAAGLPQAPNNAGPEGLGFAGSGFRALLAGTATEADLRIGSRLGGAAAKAVHAALGEAARTIARMPALYMTYPQGGPILPVQRSRPGSAPEALLLDGAYLRSFGSVRVPLHLWRALQRFAAWVEPALVAEWTRLMGDYARRMAQVFDTGAAAAAMRWAEPERDVALSRRLALGLLESGAPLRCAWTGRALVSATLDIDHLFPWSAWPCGDLWNLLPAHREVNQRLKRDRLPSAPILAAAEARILGWWQAAYLQANDRLLPVRFGHEARASLRGLGAGRGECCNPEQVFAAVGLQRLRLHQDQQVPEWTMPRDSREGL